MATIPKTGNRKCWRVIDVRDMTVIETQLSYAMAAKSAGGHFKPCCEGYKLISCDGAAHGNPNVDNCTQCAPLWGWIMIPDRTDEQYRAQARAKYEDEGQIEIDEGAEVSRGDDPGAYVQAWVWVADEDAE